jgi:hypothetical protein
LIVQYRRFSGLMEQAPLARLGITLRLIMRLAQWRSPIRAGGGECALLDELAARRGLVAHQLVEDGVGPVDL